MAARHWPADEVPGAFAEVDTGVLSPGGVAGRVAGWLRDA